MVWSESCTLHWPSFVLVFPTAWASTSIHTYKVFQNSPVLLYWTQVMLLKSEYLCKLWTWTQFTYVYFHFKDFYGDQNTLHYTRDWGEYLAYQSLLITGFAKHIYTKFMKNYRKQEQHIYCIWILKKSKVCIRAKRPIRPELIPVSVAWSD